MYQCNLCCYAPELCKTMRNYAKLRETTRHYAKLCETMRHYAKLCETMQNYCSFTIVLYPPPCPQGTRGVFLRRKLGTSCQLLITTCQWLSTSCQLLRTSCQSRRTADYLNSFEGPHGPVSGLVGISCMKIFDVCFACFSILHLFTFLSPNTPQEGSNKC